MTDRLGEMYDQQCEHVAAYGVGPAEHPFLGDKAVQAAIRENAGYVIEELMEAVNLLKNKPWKKTFVPVDRTEFLDELADTWHFWLQLHIVAGVDPQEVYEAYFKKSLVNENRREVGY